VQLIKDKQEDIPKSIFHMNKTKYT